MSQAIFFLGFDAMRKMQLLKQNPMLDVSGITCEMIHHK
jgi:hypothetical protein